MKASDIPLVRGGKLTPEMLRFIAKIAELFPGSERDLIIILKPNSALTAQEE